MPKKLASSQQGRPPRKHAFKNVDQAFSHYFPSRGSKRSRLLVRESGSELAERVFAKIAKLGDL